MRPDFDDEAGQEYRRRTIQRDACLQEIGTLERKKNRTYAENRRLERLKKTVLPDINNQISKAEMAMPEACA